MKRQWIKLVVILVLIPNISHAKRRNLNDIQKGITFGAGLYYHPSSTANRFEPVKGLGGDNNTFNNLGSDKILPYRMGLFLSGPMVYAEGFFRYVRTENEWQRTAPSVGLGKTTYKGMGGGAILAYTIAGAESSRILAGVIGESISHTAVIEYAPANEKLKLSSSNLLLGPMLQAELYLGDLWSFSLMSAYEYGMASTWSVNESAKLFGTTRLAGTARVNDQFANPIVSEFGGLLLEATFRLSFY